MGGKERPAWVQKNRGWGGRARRTPTARLRVHDRAHAELAHELACLPGKGVVTSGAVAAALRIARRRRAFEARKTQAARRWLAAAVAVALKGGEPFDALHRAGSSHQGHAQARWRSQQAARNGGPPARPQPRLTSFGAATELRVMRFSAPGRPPLPAPAATITVSALGTSLITPRIHPPVDMAGAGLLGARDESEGAREQWRRVMGDRLFRGRSGRLRGER